MSTFHSASKNFSSDSKKQIENNIRKKKQEFKILQTDFPSLTSNVSDKDENLLDYRGAVTLENPSSQTKDNDLPKGWVRLSFENGNSGKVKHEYNEKRSEDEESLHFQTLCAINQLYKNWEVYRGQYNDFYGDDSYEKLYGNYLENCYMLDYNSESDDEY